MKIGEIYECAHDKTKIEIIKIDNKRIYYKNLNNNQIFSYGIKAFKYCNLIKIK